VTEQPGEPGESEQQGAEPVGSLAEEAARLFAALAGMARDHGADDPGGRAASEASDQSRPTGLGDRAAAAVHEIDEHLATGGEDCRYCPICRAVALVRHTSPEAVDHLAEAARSLSRAVAAMLSTANVEDRRDRHRDRSGVEHIDLDDGVDDEPLDPDAQDPELEEDG